MCQGAFAVEVGGEVRPDRWPVSPGSWEAADAEAGRVGGHVVYVLSRVCPVRSVARSQPSRSSDGRRRVGRSR